MELRAVWLFVCSCCITGVAGAQLKLSLHSKVDISHLGFGAVGGADFDDVTGRLWICDGGNNTNDVAEVDPLTGTSFTVFDASVIPGMTAGPDALALHPTTRNLFLFSVFSQFVAGEVTQAGVLVKSLPTGRWPAAAFNKQGELYVCDDSPGGAFLLEVDPATGAVLSTLPLPFSGRPAAADFDPVTGNLFVWEDTNVQLQEIDVTTGAILSTTSMIPFVTSPSFPTGFAFNANGTMLHFSCGVTDHRLVNLNRNAVPPPVVYCTAKVNSLGCVPAIGSSGVASASGSAGFVVEATNVRNQKPGVLLYSVNGRAAIPFQGGFICEAPPIRRSPPLNSGGHAPQVSDCLAAYRIDMNAYASGARHGHPDPMLSSPGTFVTCQWWARDPGDAFGTSLTDALQYVVGP